jgi:hypothetical protein
LPDIPIHADGSVITPDAGQLDAPNQFPSVDATPPSVRDAPSELVRCDPGQHVCLMGGLERCVSNNDSETCGQRCQPCPTVQHGKAVCESSSVCSFQCDAGATACSDGTGVKSACGPTSWGFEDGSVNPWDHFNSGADSAVVGNVTVSQELALVGTRALKAAIQTTDDRHRILVGGRVCPEQTTMARRGTTLSLHVYIGAPPGTPHTCSAGLWVRRPGQGSQYLGPTDFGVNVTPGQWTRLQYSVTDEGANHVTSIQLVCSLGGPSWTGAVYVDEVKID